MCPSGPTTCGSVPRPQATVRSPGDAGWTSCGPAARATGRASTVASRLQAQVRTLGGDPEDDSSFTAAAHRGFMDLKQAVMGNNDEAVIEEVERGEDYLKAKYEAALEDSELSPGTRQIIEQAYQSVRRGHDTASAMKHQMEG